MKMKSRWPGEGGGGNSVIGTCLGAWGGGARGFGHCSGGGHFSVIWGLSNGIHTYHVMFRMHVIFYFIIYIVRKLIFIV